MNGTARTVSFVVPTKNAARTLDACLASLAAQDYPHVEIVVVDNNSTDGTIEIARRHAHQLATWGPERSAQRNHGAQLARGEVLVFIDADMVVEPAVARECVDALPSGSPIGALVLPELSFGSGFFARCRALEKQLYLGDDRVESARAFTRQAFDAVGGYDVELNAFEDWDVADRVRARGWRRSRITAQVWHDDGAVSPVRQFRKKRYYGKQSGRYLARHEMVRRRRLVRPSLVSKPGLLLARPWVTAGLVWLKACEVVGLASGVARLTRPHPAHPRVEVGPRPGPRVLHVVAEFSSNEGIGRSILELAKHAPGSHHLVAARVRNGAESFASVHRMGGSMAAFPITRARRLRAVIADIAPDVIHLHGGPLVSLWAPLPVLRAPRSVASVYVWPRLPSLRSLVRVSLFAATRSQVLRPRILLSTVLPTRAIAALFRRGGVDAVLTPDPGTVARLRPLGMDVHFLPVSVLPDPRRARLDAERPVVVFAGRAETVRGVDTLLDAVPRLRNRFPRLVVRLLLISRPEAEALGRDIEHRGLADAVQVVTDPVADLRDGFAGASVAVFPFKFDHVTLPPALTVAEAMSVGLPVVGTDVACVSAILRDDVNGVMVPIDAPDALASAIGDLLDDPARWDRLARGAAQTIEDVAAERVLSRIAGDLYQLTATPMPTPRTTRKEHDHARARAS